MQSQLDLTKPNVALFLDIDGVLNFGYEDCDKIDKIVEEMTGEEDHTVRCFSCLTCLKGGSKAFEKSAIECLDALIEKITKTVNLHIIISSSWRENRSVDDLKQIFSTHQFSNYIIDKTTEIESVGWEKYCVVKHSFIRCRASQIKEWIDTHPKYLGYLIFDDEEICHLQENFGDENPNQKFISTCNKKENTKKILTKEHIDLACSYVTKFLGQS